MKNKFCKPVLSSEDIDFSGYLSTSQFILTPNQDDDNERIEKKLSLRFNLNLVSDSIKNLVDQNLVSIGLKVTTELFSYFQNINSLSDEILVEVPANKLQRVDKVECQAFILAKDDLEISWNQELINLYERGEKYQFNKNEILAISNLIRYSFHADIGSLVSICDAKDPNLHGLKFSADSNNRLQVKVNTELNEAIIKLRGDAKKVRPKLLLDYYTIFSAIVYGLTKIVFSKDIEKYRGKEWFKTLSHSFNEEDMTFEEFLQEMIDNPDLDRIYQVAQELISNKLEEKIIYTWRKA